MTGLGAAAGMASGMAKKGVRDSKKIGSTASSTLGSGDGAFMGSMTGGVLANDDDHTVPSDTGMDASIADASDNLRRRCRLPSGGCRGSTRWHWPDRPDCRRR